MTDPANARNRLAHLSASNSKVVASMLTSVVTLPAQLMSANARGVPKDRAEDRLLRQRRQAWW